MRIILATIFVLVWLTAGYHLAQHLSAESELVTSLIRSGFALIWIWSMWVLADLILGRHQKN
jgi:hypothetical protein